MTNSISFPKDIWIEIFTYLDREGIKNINEVCKSFKAWAEDPKVEGFMNSHPFEAFARFYLKTSDAKTILNKLHQLPSECQDAIKAEIWTTSSSLSLLKQTNWDFDYRDWSEAAIKKNAKNPLIFKTVIAVGKLGLRISALDDLQKVVENADRPYESVITALQKLSKLKFESSYPKVGNLEEAVKYCICTFDGSPENALDYGLNFIQQNPHDPKVLKAIRAVQVENFRLFKVSKELITDPRLESLAQEYQLSDFINLHEQSDDIDAILLQFSNLDPVYQKLIKISIWIAGGKQTIPLGDWAEEEMKTNMKGDVVNHVKQRLKQHSLTLSLAMAESMITIHALTELKEIVSDKTKSSEDVMNALQKLENEVYEEDSNAAEVLKLSVFKRISPAFTETQHSYAMREQAAKFIRENPHDKLLIECIDEVRLHLETTMNKR